MRWKLTTLIENHEDAKGCYQCEHGFSILIENDDFKMLMDTGKSGAFYDNALKMGENLKDLDAICLSHGHYDHTGGLLRLLQETGRQNKLYIGSGCFDKRYYRDEKECRYIGIQFDKEQLYGKVEEIIEVKNDVVPLAPGICLHRNFEEATPYETWNPGFCRKEEDGEAVLDRFEDECALALETDHGVCVIVGCSHPGVVNILKTIAKRTGQPIRGVIGGTHLMDADEKRLEQTMEDFKKLGMEFIAVSHCTGEKNIETIRRFFDSKFIFNCTGNQIYL